MQRKNPINNLFLSIYIRYDMQFILDSDLHYSVREHGQRAMIRPDKKNDVLKIIRLCNQYSIEVVLTAGDLTNTGLGRHCVLDKFTCCCYPQSKLKHQGDEVKAYIEDFVETIEKDSCGIVYSCLGNHDVFTRWPYLYHPMTDFVIGRHGNEMYDFVKGGVHFICCSVYPDQMIIEWLKLILKKNIFGKVIFFHYNIQGQWSDWWSDDEKEIFYNTIKESKIYAICVGHGHSSHVKYWKDIPVIRGAGESVALCTIENDECRIEFY